MGPGREFGALAVEAVHRGFVASGHESHRCSGSTMDFGKCALDLAREMGAFVNLRRTDAKARALHRARPINAC